MRITSSLTTVALAAALVLTSCGDDGDDPAATSTGDSVSGEPTGDLSTGESVDVAGFIADLKSGMEDATTAHMTMEMSAMGQEITAEGDIDYTAQPPEMAMAMSMPALGSKPVEMRFVDGWFYMNLGPGSGDKFTRFSLEELSGMAGAGGMDLTKAMDPSASFETYEEGLQEVTYEGEDDVDGVSTQRYHLVIDTSKVSQFQNLPPMSAGAIPETMEMDLWLDDENRMTQMELELGSLMSMTANVFGWGDPVEIEKPARSEIFTGRLAG